jgi:hypothetical protein
MVLRKILIEKHLDLHMGALSTNFSRFAEDYMSRFKTLRRTRRLPPRIRSLLSLHPEPARINFCNVLHHLIFFQPRLCLFQNAKCFRRLDTPIHKLPNITFSFSPNLASFRISATVSAWVDIGDLLEEETLEATLSCRIPSISPDVLCRLPDHFGSINPTAPNSLCRPQPTGQSAQRCDYRHMRRVVACSQYSATFADIGITGSPWARSC